MRFVAIGLIATAIAIGAVVATGGGGGGSQTTGNLFVGAAGTCTRSGTLVSYNATTSCGSFDAAYQAAIAGDIILVENGSYGSQTILHRSTGETAPAITLEPDGTATVSLSGLEMGHDPNTCNCQGPGYLTVKGPMTLSGGLNINWSSHITIDNLTVNRSYGSNVVVVDINAASDHITIQNSDLCCTTDGKVVFTDGFGGPNYPAGNNSVSDITLNNNYIHGVNWSNSLAHSECIYANGIARLTLTNNMISQCGTTGGMDVTTSGSVDAPVGPYLIQQNVWGDQINTSYNIQGTFPTSTTVAYNTFTRDVSALVASTVMRGNVGVGGGCGAGTYAYNVFKDHTCGATDTFSSTVFNSGNWVSFPGLGSYPSPPVDWSGIADFNMKPTGGSPVVGKGDPANFPTTDKAGVTRTNPPDAGALQH